MRYLIFVLLLAACSAPNPFECEGGGCEVFADGGVDAGGDRIALADSLLPDAAGAQDAAITQDALAPSDAANAQEADMVSVPDLATVPDLAPPCVTTLANVGAGDFTIRFTLQSNAQVLSTLLYQRSSCDGNHDYWDVRLLNYGDLLVEVGQAGAPTLSLITNVVVHDGKTHGVVVQRRNQVLVVLTDGVLSKSVAAPQVLGPLPPLGVAMWHPCEGGQDGTHQLVGTVSNVCMTTP